VDFFVSSLPQCLGNGLTRGSIYALIAIGFTIIYNSTDIINFAQGEFAMLGGLIAISLAGPLGLPLWAAVPAAVAAVVLIGALFELATIHQLKSPSVINLIIITIGGSIFFKGSAMLIWGKDDHPLPAFAGTEPIHLGTAALSPQSLWVWGTTLAAVIVLHQFFARTITGKALRACAHNPTASSLMGVNVRRMVLITFALSGGLGALAGVIITPMIFANYQVGTLIGLKGFCAAILGGMGSIYGSVIGGLLIGVLESLFGTHVSSGYMDAFAFVVMLIMLFIRPRGIMGEASGERA
jgi:branched-chain amino acid transport system permease protein